MSVNFQAIAVRFSLVDVIGEHVGLPATGGGRRGKLLIEAVICGVIIGFYGLECWGRCGKLPREQMKNTNVNKYLLITRKSMIVPLSHLFPMG